MNPYYKAESESALFDEDAFGFARGEFVDNRQRFYNRLACAQYFDTERFEAVVLWLASLKRFHEANAEPMPTSYFDDFEGIRNHLEIQSTYSPTQKKECLDALHQWDHILTEYGVRK